MVHTYSAVDLADIFAQADAALMQLVEALTRKQIDRSIAPFEATLQKECAVLFNRQSRDFLAQFGTMRKYFAESMQSDFDDLFDSATLDTSSAMQQAIEKGIKQALLIGGKGLIRNLKAQVNFSLTNPRAIAYSEAHAGEAITNIDRTTKDDIRRIIVAGISDGASYSEVAANIKARYVQYAVGVPQRHIRSRAELISVTEIGNAYQAGNHIAAQSIAATGVKMEKSWLTSNDDRVSDGCTANQDDGWIDIEAAHSSGHQTPLRFPGCRCVEQYRYKRKP